MQRAQGNRLGRCNAHGKRTTTMLGTDQAQAVWRALLDLLPT